MANIGAGRRAPAVSNCDTVSSAGRELAEFPGVTNLSKSLVSVMAAELDELVAGSGAGSRRRFKTGGGAAARRCHKILPGPGDVFWSRLIRVTSG
jgi:hypothetical protein